MKRRRILLLTHRVPYPPNRGDRIRAWQMLRYLSNENDVYLASPADEPVGRESKQELAKHCVEFVTPLLGKISRWGRGAWAACRGQSISQGMFTQPALQVAIDRWQHEQPFDVAIAYCSTMFPYLEGTLWNRVPKLVDLIDVDSRKWQDFALTRGVGESIYTNAKLSAVARLERRIVESVDLVAVTTQVEAQVLRQVTRDAHPLVIANGVEVVAQRQTKTESVPGRLVFIGVLDYRPNVDGIMWFVKHVWPQVLASYPQATLEIVGRNPVRSVLDLSQVQGVSVIANTPNVRPHLHAAEIVIAPLHIARGVQNKVLEALAEQRAAVVTSAACQGLGVTAGKQLVVADDAAAWKLAIHELLQSPERRAQLVQAGYEYVKEHHQWSACLAPLGDWLREVSPLATKASRSQHFEANLPHTAEPMVKSA